MSVYGKILAVLNVVAAIGFLVVAGMDWGQRERWTYAVYRHDLLLDGLPIDAKEKDVDGKLRVERFNADWFSPMFAKAGGRPVKTQMEEVDTLQKQVQGKIDAEGGGTKTQKLARYLQPLATTYQERKELGDLMADEKADKAADLQKRFDEHFAGVKETGADGHKQSDGERKANAARLLFILGDALNDDPNADYMGSQALQRLVLVCGLSTASRAIDDQALVLQNMTDEAVRAHHAELNQFVTDHSQIIYDDQNISDAVERLERFLQAKQAEVEKEKQVVNQRKVEIDKLNADLSALRQDTAKNLEAQTQQEQEVMQRLTEMRDMARKNQELERRIRELEGVPAAGAQTGGRTR
jgi:hypothetical protein